PGGRAPGAFRIMVWRWRCGSVHGPLRRRAVVAAGELIDLVLLVAGVLEGFSQLGRGHRRDPVLEEERGGPGPQLGDTVAGLQRTVVVVLDQHPAVVLGQRLVDLD